MSYTVEIIDKIVPVTNIHPHINIAVSVLYGKTILHAGITAAFTNNIAAVRRERSDAKRFNRTIISVNIIKGSIVYKITGSNNIEPVILYIAASEHISNNNAPENVITARYPPCFRPVSAVIKSDNAEVNVKGMI